MAKDTQCARILRHMHDCGAIDPMIAIREYGCLRLAARIADLRSCGHAIESRRVKSKNRYGESTSWCEYRLADKEETKCSITL
jgi:hypothetical protein